MCNLVINTASIMYKLKKFKTVNAYKALTRSRYDKMLGGVAGGLAEYLGMDSAIIRFLFILLLFVAGTGIWIYIILWIILPFGPLKAPWNTQPPKPEDNMEHENPYQTDPTEDPMGKYNEVKRKRRENSNFITGIILITIGMLFLISELVPRIDFGHLWPIVLIVIGGLLLRNYYSANKPIDPGDRKQS